MLAKKSAVAFCGSSNIHSTISSTSITSYPSSTVRRRRSERCPRCEKTRSYATVADDGATRRPKRISPSEADMPSWPSKPHPTPYDIFGQLKNAPYNKAAYYRLAKIYHPDKHRHDNPNDFISRSTKLERYRLIVAAHTILSDPVKRHAYDLYGAGWDPAAKNPSSSSTTSSAASDFRPRHPERQTNTWRNTPNSCAGNATWEDWERWRAVRDSHNPAYKGRPQQDAVYMSNTMFAGILAVFVALGGVGQSKRAAQSTQNLMDEREVKHEMVSAGLRRRKAELAMVGREERVDRFVRDREGWPGEGG